MINSAHQKSARGTLGRVIKRTLSAVIRLTGGASYRIGRRTTVVATALSFLVGVAEADPSAWEVNDGARRVIVEGSQAFAVKTAIRLRAIEATSAWLLRSPDAAYAPPTTLVFELEAATVRRVFSQQPGVSGPTGDPHAPIGAAVALPSLSLVVAPRGPERSLEFAPLQSLYGSLLPGLDRRMAVSPTCVQQAVEALLTAASYENSNRLVIDAMRFVGAEVMHPEVTIGPTFLNVYGVRSPAEFLDPTAAPNPSETDIHARAFACLVFTHWYVTADTDQRSAFDRLFASLADGRPLADSVPDALGGSLREFTLRYRTYATRWLEQPRSFTVRRTLPVSPEPPPDPVALSVDRLAGLLRQTCLKLSRCHSP